MVVVVVKECLRRWQIRERLLPSNANPRQFWCCCLFRLAAPPTVSESTLTAIEYVQIRKAPRWCAYGRRHVDRRRTPSHVFFGGREGESPCRRCRRARKRGRPCGGSVSARFIERLKQISAARLALQESAHLVVVDFNGEDVGWLVE